MACSRRLTGIGIRARKPEPETRKPKLVTLVIYVEIIAVDRVKV
jgi:hypothetical protein